MKLAFEKPTSADVLRTAAVAAFTLAATVGFTGTASAEGATVNRGACMSELAHTAVSLVADQAPGQTNNGPLTIVNGEAHVPTAFDGGVGCAR